jgi:hypothetical protein
VRIKTYFADILDNWISHMPKLEDIYVPLRARVILSRYRRYREHYAKVCGLRSLAYQEEDTIAQVRQRLSNRGYNPVEKRLGEVHTFAIIPRLGWHIHLYDDLQILGPVTEFDYVALGYDWSEFYKANSAGRLRRHEMNAQIIPAIEKANRRRPVDWAFVYASGLEISAQVVSEIEERFGIPTVSMCLDDKQSWEGPWMDDHRAGQIDIARVFDLCWTSAKVATGWYLAEGGSPIYLPEGCNPKIYRPLPIKRDIPVSFMGNRYGFRASTVRFLRKYGIPIRTYGNGWGTRNVWGEEAAEVFCRSQINLGMGGIGYSEELTNVKTRDFEVPCTGGGIYVTSFNPDLALHFDLGKEIVCYGSRDEMLELIRYYLDRTDEANEISRAGRARCLAEHRWLHRYVKICQILRILDDSLTPSQLVKQHSASAKYEINIDPRENICAE